MARTYETTITLGAKLASTFKSVMGGASTELARLGKEAAKLQTLDRSTESFHRLNDQAFQAQRRFNTAASVLDRMRAEAHATGVATKQLADEIKAAEKVVAKEERALTKAKDAAHKAGDALRIAGVDTSKLASEQVRLASQLERTERRMQAVTNAQAAHKRLFGDRGFMERVFGDPKEARIDKLGRQVKGLASDAVKLGALGAAAGFGLFELVKHAADAGDSINDAADKLQIGGAALQAFRLQGKLAGAEIGDVDNAIGKLSINIGKVLAAKKKGGGGSAGFGPIEGLSIFGGPGAAGKGGGTENPFKHIGLDVKELSKLKPDEQIEKVADAIVKLKTQSEKSAAAVALFGKGGLKMLPVLAQGGAALRKYREEGVRTGQFMSNEAVAASNDFNDALEALQSRGVNLLANALSGELMPVFTDTFKGIAAWLSQNQDKIKAWAKMAALWIRDTAIPAVKDAGKWFLDTGGKIVSVVQKAADLAGGFGNLAIAVGLLRAAPLVKTSLEIIAALVKMTASVASYALALDGAATSQKALGGGVGGASGGGASGATKALSVLAAGSTGFAIGTALDSLFGLSDKLSGHDAQFAQDRADFEGDRLKHINDRIARGLPAQLSAPAVAGPSTYRNSAGYVVHFSPQISVNGATAKADIDASLKAGADDLEQRLKALHDNQRRLAYE